MKKLFRKYISICAVVFSVGIYLNFLTFNLFFNTFEMNSFCFDLPEELRSENFSRQIYDTASDKQYSIDELDEWIEQTQRLKTGEPNPGNHSYFEQKSHDIDSVFNKLYAEGKLDYFYDKLKEYNRSPSRILSKDRFPESDSLSTILTYFQTFHGLEYSDIKHRSDMLREALLPLGYKESLRISVSFNDSVTIEYSHTRLFLLCFAFNILHGLVWNPLLYIFLPVAVLLPVFSRESRQTLGRFFQGILLKIKRVGRR